MDLFSGKKAHLDFDDGRFEGIRRVMIRDDNTEVLFIQVEYEKAAGGTEVRRHGVDNGTWEEFVVNYPDEYTTSVECTYGLYLHLRHLVLVTSSGRKSRTFGSTETVDPPLNFDQITSRANAPAIVGFHGRSGNHLIELKAHFGPAPPKKLEAIGGIRGEDWDDGKYENMRKISVGRGLFGIAFLQIDYTNGTTVVHGDVHGMETYALEKYEFTIPYEKDHVASVEVYRNNIGKPDEHIIALQFKTHNGKSSKLYGIPSREKYILKGHKIVGFHGRSSNKQLKSLGVRISYPPIPHLSGTWSKVTQKGQRPKPRCSNAIAMVGQKMYSFGGQLNSDQPIDKYLYVFDDPTDTWSVSPARGNVPEFSCFGAAMVSVGSMLYVFGGKDHSGNYSGFYCFDTTTNEWQLLTPVGNGPIPRSFHSMATIGNMVFVFGGLSETGPLNTLDAYEIEKRTWLTCLAPGYPLVERERAGLQVVNGKLWVLYGFNESELDDVHCYDPDQGIWNEVKTFGEKPGGLLLLLYSVTTYWSLEVRLRPLMRSWIKKWVGYFLLIPRQINGRTSTKRTVHLAEGHARQLVTP